MTASFQSISTTREEYLAVIEDLKASAPPVAKKTERRPKLEQVHLNLISRLECRIEAIDAELAVSCVRTLNFDFFSHGI